MKKEIIDKLQLIETNMTIGNSFIYGIKVYKYSDNIYLAKCNRDGTPNEKDMIIIFNEATKEFVRVSEEMLLKVRNEFLDKLS